MNALEIKVGPEVVLVSVIGQQLRMTPGIAGQLFSVLAYHEINVLAITDCASDSKLTFAVEAQSVNTIVEILRQEFA